MRDLQSQSGSSYVSQQWCSTLRCLQRNFLRRFSEDRVICEVCKIKWPPRLPGLIPLDFWMCGYVKYLVYLSTFSTPTELKDALQFIVSEIHPDMLYSAVTDVGLALLASYNLVDVMLNNISLNKSLKT